MATPRKIGWRDHVVGIVLAASYVSLLLASSAELGMSRDESFYVDAANQYGGWFELLAEDSSRAFRREAVDRMWHYNHEHPSLVKSVFAFFHLLQEDHEIFDQAAMSYRFGGMLSAGLLLWLIYIFGARVYGRPVGIFAALAFALMPRIFYHSQLDCFDVPIVLMMTLVTYCYWRGLTDWRWVIVTGIVYGLALETKHNAWMLPAIFWIHWIFIVLGQRHQGGEAGWRRRLFLALAILGPLLAIAGTFYFAVLAPVLDLRGSIAAAVLPIPLYLVLTALAARWARVRRWRIFVPSGLLACVVIGPPLFVALWPWMWFDTAARFHEYASFHLNHVHYNMVYFGTNYFGPPLPMSFPWVLTLFTVPLATLVLAVAGFGARARALLPPGLLERLWPKGRVEPDSARTDVLLAGMMLAPIVVISMPWTPIFGGTKHWFAAYPFLCLFAGIAFVWVARAVRERLPDRIPAPSYVARFASAAILLSPAVIETIHSHPFGLSHYTFAAGGVPGAADHGMNRQFWGFTTGSLTGWLEEQMPNGGSVWICDTTWGAWGMLHRDGRLDRRIRASGDLPGADFAIVHHEHHFVEVDYQIWAAWGSVQPVHVLTYDGVPIISVYENPHRRQTAQRGGPVR